MGFEELVYFLVVQFFAVTLFMIISLLPLQGKSHKSCSDIPYFILGSAISALTRSSLHWSYEIYIYLNTFQEPYFFVLQISLFSFSPITAPAFFLFLLLDYCAFLLSSLRTFLTANGSVFGAISLLLKIA